MDQNDVIAFQVLGMVLGAGLALLGLARIAILVANWLEKLDDEDPPTRAA